MNIEARKRRIIKMFASTKDLKKIDKIESVLLVPNENDRRALINDLSGKWPSNEADEMSRAINEGCEKIDNNEW